MKAMIPVLSQRLTELGVNSHDCKTALIRAVSRGWFHLPIYGSGKAVATVLESTGVLPKAPAVNGPAMSNGVYSVHGKAFDYGTFGFGYYDRTNLESRAGVKLPSYTFSNRCWRVWYQAKKATSMQEVDCSNSAKSIGGKISL